MRRFIKEEKVDKHGKTHEDNNNVTSKKKMKTLLKESIPNNKERKSLPHDPSKASRRKSRLKKINERKSLLEKLDKEGNVIDKNRIINHIKWKRHKQQVRYNKKLLFSFIFFFLLLFIISSSPPLLLL